MRRNPVRKAVSLLLAILFTVLVISGCAAQNNQGAPTGAPASASAAAPTPAPASAAATASAKSAPKVNPPGQLPITSEKITISAFVGQNPKVQDVVTNTATVEMEKRTNIHLDMVVVPTDALAEKKTLLLAGGDYPEIFLEGGFTPEEVMMYGSQQKIFIPLNNLIQQYAPEVTKTYTEIPNFKPDITAPDGNIYALPQINECYHCFFRQKYWMNTKWLETLKLKIPETTDELYTVLKAFKEKDPNGNGKRDEIPMSGRIDDKTGVIQHFMMNAFIYDDGLNFFSVEDGKLQFVADKPKWKEGLKYENKLYKEGLIDPAAFTQKTDQLKMLGDNKPDVILGGASALHPSVFVSLSDKPELARHKDYNAIAPLKGPDGFQTTPYTRGISAYKFAITDKCKNPEAAIRLLDFFYSEPGTLLIEEGIEGVNWKKADPGKLNLMGQQAKYDRIVLFETLNVQNANWKQAAPTKRGSEFDGLRGFWATDQNIYTEAGYEKRLFEATKNLYEGKQPKAWFNSVFIDASQIEEAAQLKVNIADYVNQSMVRFITGDMDIDNGWDSYIKQLNAMGLPRYMEIYGKAYELKMKNK